MGKLTVSMAMFHSYVKLPEGITQIVLNQPLPHSEPLPLEGIVPKRRGDHEKTTRLTFVPEVFKPDGLLLNEFWRVKGLMA